MSDENALFEAHDSKGIQGPRKQSQTRMMKIFDMKCSFQFLTMFMLFSLLKTKNICKPEEQVIKSQYFHEKVHGVPSLKEKIISESLERSWLDCGSSCLAQRFCVGYNYKKNSRENEVNCQLTHTADHWFDKITTEDSDWTFYEAVAGRMSGCGEDSECQNGGTMVWDPVKSFKCECPENYVREFCQQKIYDLSDSEILTKEPRQFYAHLTKWLPIVTGNWTVCWRASEHGWGGRIFHNRCDDEKPTLTIVKVVKDGKNFIFGGFATASFKGPGFIHAPGSFIFSLRNNDNLTPFKTPLINDLTRKALYSYSDSGPSFRYDLFISDKANSRASSSADLGREYQTPPGYKVYEENTQALLAGSENFTPLEVEVLYFHE